MTNYDNTDEVNDFIDRQYNQLADAIYELVEVSFSLGGVVQFGAFGFISNLKHPNKGEHERLMYLYDNHDHQKRVFVNINDLEMSHDIFNTSRPHGYYMTNTQYAPKEPKYPDIRRYRFHLVVPIFNAKKRIIGLISLHAIRDNAFTVDDAIMLRNIADHISEKLDDIELAIQISERMKIINQVDKDIINKIKIGRAGGEESRKTIWQFVLENSCKLTGAYSGSIFHVSDDLTTLVREATYPHNADRLERFPINEAFTIAEPHPQRLSVEMAQNVLGKKNQQEFLLINNRRKERRHHKDYTSALSVPIIGADNTLKGILTLVSDEENYFNDNHVAFVKTLAGQAAVATTSAEQVNRFYQMVITNHEFSKKPFDDVLKSILQTIISILDPNGTRRLIGTLRRVNIFTNTLDLVSNYYSNLLEADEKEALKAYFEISKHFPIEDQIDMETDTRKPHGLVGRVVCDCARYKIDDTDHLTDETRDYLAMPNVRSIMSVGIWGKNVQAWDAFQTDKSEQNMKINKRDGQKRHAVRGVISIMSPKENVFTDIEFEILTYFSNLIALVWAYHLQKRRIEVLMDIAERWQKATIYKMEDLKIWDEVWRIFTIGAMDESNTTLRAHGTFSEYRVDGKLIWKRADDEETKWLPKYVDEIDVFDAKGGFSGAGVQAWVAYHNLKRKHDSDHKHNDLIIANIPNTTVKSGYLEVSYSSAQPHRAYIGKFKTKRKRTDIIGGLYRNEIVYRYKDAKFQTRSELCVPIVDIVAGKIQLRGLINIESPTAYAFDEDDEQIIDALARQVWNALNRIDYHIGEDSEDYTYHIAASTHTLAGDLSSIIKSAEEFNQADEKITPILEKLYTMKNRIDEIEEIKKNLGVLEQSAPHETITLTKLLNEVFDSVYEKRKDLVPKKRDDILEINCQTDDTLYLARDKVQLLKLVFDNLFKNSFTHRRLDGVVLKIVVSIRPTKVANMLEIEVRDNGKGIPKHERDTLFTRHTHKRSAGGLIQSSPGGMGIGLFLAKKILTYKIGGGIDKKPNTKHQDDFANDQDHYNTYTAFTLWIPREDN